MNLKASFAGMPQAMFGHVSAPIYFLSVYSNLTQPRRASGCYAYMLQASEERTDSASGEKAIGEVTAAIADCANVDEFRDGSSGDDLRMVGKLVVDLRPAHGVGLSRACIKSPEVKLSGL